MFSSQSSITTATVCDSFQIAKSYAVTKKTTKAICFNSGKFSSIGQPESIAAVQNRHTTSIVSPIRDVYVGVVSSCDPALDCALAGFPRGILLQHAIKRMHFYERKMFCSKGKLRMCFCTQGSLMWMSVGERLNHECIVIQRNAPCVCVCVCVCEYGEFVKMEMGIPCYTLFYARPLRALNPF